MNYVVGVLTFFGAAFLLKVLIGNRNISDFVFILCCFIASFYFCSGLGKLRINWITHPHLNLLIFGAYANDWLAFLEPSTIVSISEKLAWSNLLLMAFTLLVEVGAIFLLWRRTLLLVSLCGFILFHSGIFAICGMLFWKWIVVEVGLLVFLLGRKRIQSIPIFTRGHFMLSIILIGGYNIWFNPSNLSWFDTRLTYSYRYEAVGESNKRYPLSSRMFTPYADMFTLGNFHYLNQHSQLTHIWGVTGNRVLADKLLQLNLPDQIYALEQEMGKIHFNLDKAARFDDLITRFIGNLNVRRSKRTWLSWLQAPAHLWSFPRDNTFKAQEQITKVIVYQVTSLYDGKQYLDIRKRVLREIDIPLLPIPPG